MEHTYKGHLIFLSPNQKACFINKAICDKEHPFTVTNQQAMRKAMQTLCPGYKSPAPFAMWCYLSKNKPNTPIYLSGVAFENYTGINQKAYRRALEVLLEKGYLKIEQDNLYAFYEDGCDLQSESAI